MRTTLRILPINQSINQRTWRMELVRGARYMGLGPVDAERRSEVRSSLALSALPPAGMVDCRACWREGSAAAVVLVPACCDGAGAGCTVFARRVSGMHMCARCPTVRRGPKWKKIRPSQNRGAQCRRGSQPYCLISTGLPGRAGAGWGQGHAAGRRPNLRGDASRLCISRYW